MARAVAGEASAVRRPVSALRVLSVAHTAVSRAAGRLRYHPLADDPTIEVQLVVPTRWHQFGRWLQADGGSDPGARVTPLPILLPRAGPAGWYLHTYPRLGQVARGFAPDVIHLWEEPWSLVALQASMLARRHGAALVLEVDQNLLKRLPQPFEWIRAHVLRHTDLILSRSSDATAVVRACGYRGRALRLSYGVDRSVFCPGAAPPPPAPLRVGYVGRIVPEKGLDDVIDAMAQARADVHLAILGEGPHQPLLRRRAEQAGLAGRVAFLPWAGPDAVASFLRAQHALVLPTRTSAAVKEQFGRAIIEAQACRTPVIGSSCGAIPDVLGRGGWVVPERDPAAMAALFERLAAAPAELLARGEDGLANVAARFTYAAVASDLARAWRHAASARAERSTARRGIGAGAGETAGAEQA